MPLQPDIVIPSEASKQLAMIELTVPCEDWIDKAFERKLARYQALLDDCRRLRWRAHCHPVEEGCKGFDSCPVYRVCTLFGMRGPLRGTAIRTATGAAGRAEKGEAMA